MSGWEDEWKLNLKQERPLRMRLSDFRLGTAGGHHKAPITTRRDHMMMEGFFRVASRVDSRSLLSSVMASSVTFTVPVQFCLKEDRDHPALRLIGYPACELVTNGEDPFVLDVLLVTIS